MGMFFPRRKLLNDPPKVRAPGNEFKFACKLCGVVGHEAFECGADPAHATFQHVPSGKIGVSYRELFRRGIVDAEGTYIRR